MDPFDVTSLPENTPVVVGVGFEKQRHDDPRECSEPYELMVSAARAAADDAGSAAILADIESISVAQGLWKYRNVGKLVADALGCPKAKSIVSDLGVLQLKLVSDLCNAIAAGNQRLGLVTGGEAKYRELRSKITGEPVSETEQGEETPEPDERHSSSDPFCSDLEAARGFFSPVELFAMIESALRYEEGLGIDEHRDKVAELYGEFSRVAAANPHAWRDEVILPDEIRNATERNSMQAFPYTKLHCSQWNVNQAVAILICSVGKARDLGLASDAWIYPLAAVESKHVVVLAQQKKLHSHLGSVLAGERAMSLADISRHDVSAAELYSCFPAAVRSFAHDFKLDEACPLSVTGAMPFAGGPFNHASLDGVARMVEVLRETNGGTQGSKPRIGLVSNLSGIFGKQGCAVFSNFPSGTGYKYEEITAEVAKIDKPVSLDEHYAGPATIVGYTVVFRGNEPSHGLAICDTPGNKRTVVRTEERDLMDAMVREEFCGRRVSVSADGSFAPGD